MSIAKQTTLGKSGARAGQADHATAHHDGVGHLAGCAAETTVYGRAYQAHHIHVLSAFVGKTQPFVA